MPNVKTVILTGGETVVTFEDSYPYYMILNMGDSEVYASGNPDIVPYADGVYTVPAGVEIRISPEAARNTVYLLGNGTVQVRAETIAVQTSFKLARKGGDPDSSIDLSSYLTKDAVTNSTTIAIADDGTLSATAVKITNLGYYTEYSAKNIGALKQDIFTWWANLYDGSSSSNTHIVYGIAQFSAGLDLIDNWSNDGYRTSGIGYNWQLTPIGSYGLLYGGVVRGTFILSCTDTNDVYILKETHRNEFAQPIKVATTADLSGYATITQLNDKQDVFLSKNKITATTDWDTVTEFGVYTVSSSSALSDINNAPPDAYGYGFLFVMSNPQTTQDIYQIYVNGNHKCYQRERYNGAWKDWAAVITDNNIPILNTFDGLVLKSKTVEAAKEIIVSTYLSYSNTFGVFMLVPSDLIEKWDESDYVLSAGGACQITPIGSVTQGVQNNKLYGKFLISGYGQSSPCFFDVSASVVGSLNKIMTSADITPEMLEKLKNL